MPPGGIKVLLFDLGNVLVDFDPAPAIKRISNFCDKRTDEIPQILFDSGIVGSFEKGMFSEREFFIRLKDALGLRLGYESFVSIWNEVFSFSPKNRAVYHIINKLRKSYGTAILSNTNILHYQYISEHFPVFGIFEKRFLSFEMGCVKPEEAIYREAVRSLGVCPESIFYTDDRPELIEGAARLGIKSYLFTGIKELLDDLSSLRVVPDAP
jgi:putative hydrolase of the HAD superfamily